LVNPSRNREAPVGLSLSLFIGIVKSNLLLTPPEMLLDSAAIRIGPVWREGRR